MTALGSDFALLFLVHRTEASATLIALIGHDAPLIKCGLPEGIAYEAETMPVP
jgi:hypothetical protein